MLHNRDSKRVEKVRFTVFLMAPLAEALTEMPRKKRHEFINEKLQNAITKERLGSYLEMMKKQKTGFHKGITFSRKIRKEWNLGDPDRHRGVNY